MKKKTIKNHIFLANTAMVVVVLVLFLAIGMIALAIYEYLEKDDVITESELASGTSQACVLIVNTNTLEKDELEALGENLEDVGFYVCVINSDEIIYTTINDVDEWDVEEIQKFMYNDDTIHIFNFGGSTLITKASTDGDLQVYAVSEDNIVQSLTVRRYTPYIVLFVICGSLLILILFVASYIYAKRLTKAIMLPLNSLIDASNDVKKGDHTKRISYAGYWEFEEVCTSFNDMNAQINKDEQRREIDEQSRRDMIAGVSHDLRTPLTAIRGTLKGLQDGVAKTPEMQRKFLDTAYRRTLEMDRLIEQLFYFSKIETGDMPVHPETIEWNAFLLSYIDNLKAKDEGVCKYCFYGCDSVCSDIDVRLMERILDNVVENAKKYAQAQELIITFNLKCKGGSVYLWVSDNGNGVAEDKLPHIFEKFYRADESRGQTEGNGLGLHIVKCLTENMNGTVTAANNNGLEIKFVFPAKEENSDEQ